jgi:hypothetical protein
MPSGESVPLSVEMLSVELLDGTVESFEPEYVEQAASAVFHYFKHDLRRDSVSVGEFTLALENVLRGLMAQSKTAAANLAQRVAAQTLEADLCRLACESGKGCELFFFPRLRDEVRQQLQKAPCVLRFRGLRGCVKQLVGAQRWTAQCQRLKEQIVAYLRECVNAEAGQLQLALVVE